MEQFGELSCRLVGDRDSGGPLIVLLHGFGAPGDDLVPLARMLDAPSDARFLFPAGPVKLPPAFFGASRAWWMLDLASMARHGLQFAAGRGVNLSNDEPQGLSRASKLVSAAIDEAAEAMKPRWIAIGGFSQGAMVSLDVALHSDRELAGVVLFSGTLVAAQRWRKSMKRRAGTRVFQSHGRGDPLLPFSLAQTLRDELRDAGLDVTWCEFDGGHEIPPDALRGAGDLIASTTASD